MNLATLGFTDHFKTAFAAYQTSGYQVGWVALEQKQMYRLYTEQGEVWAEVAGKLRHAADSRGDYPAVGDFVAISLREKEQRATIHAILPRFSCFSRKLAGMVTDVQIVAANVNTVFLVSALNHDFNLRRIERYLAAAWESGASPVVVLNKADLCASVEEQAAAVQRIALGAPVHAVSTLTRMGMDELLVYLQPGQTIALVGSSGVGKSSIINFFLGAEQMRVTAIREGDGRGRHTTTHRELFFLPQDALMIDTPGMRELQLWDASSGLAGAFTEIETWAVRCFYRDCLHHKEPGCAVLQAIADGELPRERYESYLKLQKELAYLARKEDQRARVKKHRG